MSKHEPISVVISRTVKPGKEKEYETLAHKAINASRQYTGHEGTTVIKEGDRRYHLVYRFSNHDKLDKWLVSKERISIRKEINHLTEEKSGEHKLTGFETWFKVPEQTDHNPPPRYKMWLATLLSAYPLVVIFQAVLAPKVESWPLLLRSALFPLILLTIMMYVIMPWVTKILKPWLYNDINSKKNKTKY
jgi:antibiotic biosynthesis monooxygenase (ABM) superfamily enzyme